MPGGRNPPRAQHQRHRVGDSPALATWSRLRVPTPDALAGRAVRRQPARTEI
jgi:hypothetical protein